MIYVFGVNVGKIGDFYKGSGERWGWGIRINGKNKIIGI